MQDSSGSVYLSVLSMGLHTISCTVGSAGEKSGWRQSAGTDTTARYSHVLTSDTDSKAGAGCGAAVCAAAAATAAAAVWSLQMKRSSTRLCCLCLTSQAVPPL